MKILLYASDFAIGGAWTYLHDLLKGLNQKGHEISLIADKTSQINKGIEQIIPYVKDVYRVEPLRSIKDMQLYIQLVRSTDIVHFNFIKPNTCFLAVILAKIFSPQTIRTGFCHLAVPVRSKYPLKPFIITQITRLGFNLLDQILVPSNATKERLENVYGAPRERIKTIYNGIDINKFESAINRATPKANLNIPTDKTIISIIARLTEQKGHLYSLNAIEKLINLNDQFHVLIVGEGNLESMIRYEIEKRNLQDHIQLLGYRNDIPEILGITDILLLTSLWEGLPYTIQEAMFCGIPVVASRVDGTPEAIIDGETGYLIDYADAEQIADRLNRLIADTTLRQKMGAAGQQRAEQRFTFESMISNTEKVFTSLLQSKGKSYS